MNNYKPRKKQQQLLFHSKSLKTNKRFLYTNLLVLEICISLDFRGTKAKRTSHKMLLMSYYII